MEDAAEVETVVEAYLVADLRDGHWGGVEQTTGLLYLQQIQVAEGTEARLLFEQRGESRRTVARELRYLLQRQPFLHVLAHVMDGQFRDVDVGWFVNT